MTTLVRYPEFLRKVLGLREAELPTHLETHAGVLPVVDVTRQANVAHGLELTATEPITGGAGDRAFYTSGDRGATAPSRAISDSVFGMDYWALVWLDLYESTGLGAVPNVALWVYNGSPYAGHLLKTLNPLPASGRIGHRDIFDTAEPYVLHPNQALRLSYGAVPAGAALNFDITILRFSALDKIKGY